MFLFQTLFRSEGTTELASKLPVAHCFHYDLTYYVVLNDVEGHIPEQVLCPARARQSYKPFDHSVNFVIGKV